MEINKFDNLMLKVKHVERILKMQTDYIDHMPDYKGLTAEEGKAQYIRAYRVLDNHYEINQDLSRELNNVADELTQIREDMEDEY